MRLFAAVRTFAAVARSFVSTCVRACARRRALRDRLTRNVIGTRSAVKAGPYVTTTTTAMTTTTSTTTTMTTKACTRRCAQSSWHRHVALCHYTRRRGNDYGRAEKGDAPRALASFFGHLLAGRVPPWGPLDRSRKSMRARVERVASAASVICRVYCR